MAMSDSVMPPLRVKAVFGPGRMLNMTRNKLSLIMAFKL